MADKAQRARWNAHNKKWKKDHVLYGVWSKMKGRCMRETDPAYKWYGKRGITVCEKWLNYKTFEKDMLSGYKKGLTLERIDNNKGYCKENCKWATRKEQANNTRNITRFEFAGMKKSFREWADFLGVKRRTLSARYYDHGWSIQKTLTFNINCPTL